MSNPRSIPLKKTCPDCKKEKSQEHFGFRLSPSGHKCLRSICGTCMSARSLAWQKKYPEKARAHVKKYWAAHKKELNAKSQERYKQNPEPYLKYQREYRKRLREAKKEV